MPKLVFRDLKTKKSFTTDKYTIKNKNGVRFALAKSPSGGNSARILGRTKGR